MRALYFVATLTATVVFTLSLLGQEVKINKKDDLPQPVLNAVEKLAPGSTFAIAEKDVEKDGMVRYEVYVTQAGRRIGFEVSSEGQLYMRTEVIDVAKLPPPVKEKLEYVCNCKSGMSMLKTTPAGGQSFYKFRLTRSVTANGSIAPMEYLGRMKEVEREDVPQPVVSAIEKLDPGTDWFAIKIEGQDAKYGESYQIRAYNGKTFVVSPQGKLDESWDLTVKVADLPESARKVVERATSGGNPEPENLIEITPAGKEPYYMFLINRSIAEDGSIITNPKKN